MGSACPARERSGQPALYSKGRVFNQKQPYPISKKSIMQFSRACLLTSSLVTLSTALPSPATGVLRSQYPEKPIEDPANWAWGQHPRNGLGYNAKDDLELEVCLANPNIIATPKCKIPLDICLDNPEWLPLVGCSGEGLPLQVCLDFPKLLTSPACEAHYSTFGAFPLDACLAYPTLLTKPACQGNQYPVETCTSMPSLLSLPSCDFTFPLDTCTAKPNLFTLPQCSANLTPQLCASTPSITRLAACTAALVGYEAPLFDCQDNKDILCSMNMCAKHEFLVKC